MDLVEWWVEQVSGDGGIDRSARWSSPTVILAIAGSSALTALLAPADKRRQIGSALGTALDASLTFFVGIGAAHRRAEEQFGTLAAPSPSDERILTDLSPRAAIGRLCLRELARAPEGRLSAAELHDRLAPDYTIPGGARSVQHELDRWSCFEIVGEAAYQVGRALVLAPVNYDQAPDRVRPELPDLPRGLPPAEA